jgi:hypothetical protein
MMSGWIGRRVGWVWLLAFAAIPMSLDAQSKYFHGFYLGAEAGREDLIGGSFVDGVDFLAQDSRRVASLVAGARYQSAPGIVVGVEGTWGSTTI